MKKKGEVVQIPKNYGLFSDDTITNPKKHEKTSEAKQAKIDRKKEPKTKGAK
jgi:hypothetical protein